MPGADAPVTPTTQVRQQLKDRLSPHCPGLRPEELEDIISECTHVFGGMQTHAQERGTSSYEYLDEFLWVEFL